MFIDPFIILHCSLTSSDGQVMMMELVKNKMEQERQQTDIKEVTPPHMVSLFLMIALMGW